jgi:hypothetical protein
MVEMARCSVSSVSSNNDPATLLLPDTKSRLPRSTCSSQHIVTCMHAGSQAVLRYLSSSSMAQLVCKMEASGLVQRVLNSPTARSSDVLNAGVGAAVIFRGRPLDMRAPNVGRRLLAATLAPSWRPEDKNGSAVGAVVIWQCDPLPLIGT